MRGCFNGRKTPMRAAKTTFLSLISVFSLSACVKPGGNPVDPYESINRKVYHFNDVLDKAILKPVAKTYKAVLPHRVRHSIDNVYNNINMIPTVINDLLQGEFHYAIKDAWRFGINSTLGVGGLFDVADQAFYLPPHSNDLGITFAKWGDKKSPYVIIPFLGPSTIRDAFGAMLQYTLMTPYPYLDNQALIWGLLGVRAVDLRSQLLEEERLMQEAMDPYSFLRDAWLQHRQFQITGEAAGQAINNALAVKENQENLSSGAPVGLGSDYVD